MANKQALQTGIEEVIEIMIGIASEVEIIAHNNTSNIIIVSIEDINKADELIGLFTNKGMVVTDSHTFEAGKFLPASFFARFEFVS